MRRFALAAAAVFTLPFVGLAWASAPASAAVTHPGVAQASTCHDESVLNDVFTSGGKQYGGNMQAYGTAAGEQVVASFGATARVEWCSVAGNINGYILLRLQGTSQCAEYDAKASDVELAACDSTKVAQNWQGEGQPTTITNEYVPDANGCLSSAIGSNPRPLVVVACSGVGGQVWYGYP